MADAYSIRLESGPIFKGCPAGRQGLGTSKQFCYVIVFAVTSVGQKFTLHLENRQSKEELSTGTTCTACGLEVHYNAGPDLYDIAKSVSIAQESEGMEWLVINISSDAQADWLAERTNLDF